MASAAGTTPRTVRHYHRLGLLAEPRRLSNGYRTYELPDLVRLMRIRWLTAAGIPLGSIAAMIEPTPIDAREPDDFAEDLSSLIAEIDRKQRVLADQRVRLQEMLTARGAGRVVSPLPMELLSAFDELIASSPTGSVRRLFERERDMWGWWRSREQRHTNCSPRLRDCCPTRATGRELSICTVVSPLWLGAR
ncbi:MerR family transcriptional regulator [Rhodococcus sp. 3Y1]